MARAIRQSLPEPPPVYDQAYIAQLTDAINRYMFQREALGELTAARLILVDPVHVPGDQATAAGLPTGMLILKPLPGSPGAYYLTVVTEQDPQ